MDVLFGGANHVEKGGDLIHVEDAHHASVQNTKSIDEVSPVKQRNVTEIKV